MLASQNEIRFIHWDVVAPPNHSYNNSDKKPTGFFVNLGEMWKRRKYHDMIFSINWFFDVFKISQLKVKMNTNSILILWCFIFSQKTVLVFSFLIFHNIDMYRDGSYNFLSFRLWSTQTERKRGTLYFQLVVVCTVQIRLLILPIQYCQYYRVSF